MDEIECKTLIIISGRRELSFQGRKHFNNAFDAINFYLSGIAFELNPKGCKDERANKKFSFVEEESDFLEGEKLFGKVLGRKFQCSTKDATSDFELESN